MNDLQMARVENITLHLMLFRTQIGIMYLSILVEHTMSPLSYV